MFIFFDGISNEMGGDLDDTQGNFRHPDKKFRLPLSNSQVSFILCVEREEKKKGKDRMEWWGIIEG